MSETEAQAKAVHLHDALAHLLDRYRDVIRGSTWSDDYDDIPRAERALFENRPLADWEAAAHGHR